MIKRQFFLSALCILFSALSVHAAPKILLSTNAILPGETLRVEADGVSPNQQCRIAFANGFYRMFGIGPDAQRALIGIRLDAVPGTYPLRLEQWVKARGNWQRVTDVSVEITTRTFVVEKISFSPEKTALMRWEHKESLQIRKALAAATEEQLWEGTFSYPVDGPIIGEFGLKRVRNETIDAGFHRGYDLKAPAGTPILAPAGGVIVLARPFKAHGRTVLVNHGQGVMTIYLHLKSYPVSPGQKVLKGDKIGVVGSTGLSTAPHVHWGLYVHGVPVDAKPWTETEF